MKKIAFILIVVLFVGCESKPNLSANKERYEYQMLSPLDTNTLPNIPQNGGSGVLVREALNGDLIWQIARYPLVWQDFSAESIEQMMQAIYFFTHHYYVGIPCAYWSQKPNGDSLLVSGQVYLPKNRKLNGIMIANHYMMTSNPEVPTNMTAMETIFLMKDYAIIMPDYVGYGLSRDETHPFLHWRNAAHTAVDLLNCMPDLLDYYGYEYPKDVVIEGYSQGASVALGVARLLEETNSEWNIRKLYAGAGPYNPALSYDYCVAHDVVGIPSLIPLLIIGMNDAYDLNLNMEDVFLEPLLSNYEEWVCSKSYPMKEIDQLMGSYRMSELMKTPWMNRDDSTTRRLYNVLLDNSNVGYDLQSPAYFIHSLDDELVPLYNTLILMENMPDNSQIEYDFQHYGTHMETSIAFLKAVFQDL